VKAKHEPARGFQPTAENQRGKKPETKSETGLTAMAAKPGENSRY
jgi:hypothetical protein